MGTHCKINQERGQPGIITRFITDIINPFFQIKTAAHPGK